MIRLTRVRSAQAVPTGFRGAKRIDRLEELIAAFQLGQFEFNSNVWKAAKKQLKIESSGKCAYCEAPTSAVAHGDVEHFRPKSVYWWLAYCYENYTYACQICNQSFKGDNFPVEGPSMQPGDIALAAMMTPDPLNEAEGMSYTDFENACLNEFTHLPDVYREDPEVFFKWVADAVKKEVRIEARSPIPRNQRALIAVEQFLGLNRAELIGLRWTLYADLEIFRDTLTALPAGHPLAQEVRDRIREMMDNSGEFAGMVRYFVRDEWNLVL